MQSKNYTEEIEVSQRRGQRIAAMLAGKEIPFPETAEADARPGNQDDAAVSACVRGQAAMIPGADTAQVAASNERSEGGSFFFTNESHTEALVCGPFVRASYA